MKKEPQPLAQPNTPTQTGLASACGMGHVFNPAHEALARKSVLTHNAVTKPPWNDLQKHLFDGDTGITVCTYPHGKLGNGMMYDTLVSTGFTSPNIAGMLLDRNTDGAELFAKYIRVRQDGRNRVGFDFRASSFETTQLKLTETLLARTRPSLRSSSLRAWQVAVERARMQRPVLESDGTLEHL